MKKTIILIAGTDTMNICNHRVEFIRKSYQGKIIWDWKEEDGERVCLEKSCNS